MGRVGEGLGKVKIIIIRDALVKTIINTYQVNDDVSLPPGCEENLMGAGYTYQVLHPIPMSQKDLDAEIEDYCNRDNDMGKVTPEQAKAAGAAVDNRTGEQKWDDDVWQYGKD